VRPQVTANPNSGCERGWRPPDPRSGVQPALAIGASQRREPAAQLFSSTCWVGLAGARFALWGMTELKPERISAFQCRLRHCLPHLRTIAVASNVRQSAWSSKDGRELAT
jgi:hypothetical protein